jgi:hypothetical protein
MFRTIVSPIAVSVALLLVSAAPCEPVQAPEFDLTGKWSCDDDGTYYLRQVGKQIWWMGESKEGGTDWTNVFHGEIKGMKLIGDWADVPRGGNLASGTLHLELQIRDGNVVEFRKKKQLSDDFGGCVWKR